MGVKIKTWSLVRIHAPQNVFQSSSAKPDQLFVRHFKSEGQISDCVLVVEQSKNHCDREKQDAAKV